MADEKTQVPYYQFANASIGITKEINIREGDTGTTKEIKDFSSVIINENIVHLTSIDLYITVPSFVILPDNNTKKYFAVNRKEEKVGGVNLVVYDLRPVTEEDDLKGEFNDAYEEKRRLGSGGFGEVYAHPTQGLAIKSMKNGYAQGYPEDYIREIAFYRAFYGKLCIPALHRFYIETASKRRHMGMQMGDATLEKIFSNYRKYMKQLAELEIINGLTPEEKANLDPPMSVEQKQIFSTSTSYTAKRDLLKMLMSHLHVTSLKHVRSLIKCMKNVSAQGIIHCDLKPENVVLVAGIPYLIDFGLAEFDRTKGQILRKSKAGTAVLIAPEIISDQTTRFTWKSDVYSMGVVLLLLYLGWNAWRPYRNLDNPHDGYRAGVAFYVSVLLGDEYFMDPSTETFKIRIRQVINEDKSYRETIKTNIDREFPQIPGIISTVMSGMLEPNPKYRSTWDEVLGANWGVEDVPNIPALPVFCNVFPTIEDITKIYEEKKLDRNMFLNAVMTATKALRGSVFTFASGIQILDLYVSKIPADYQVSPKWGIASTWLAYKLHDRYGRGAPIILPYDIQVQSREGDNEIEKFISSNSLEKAEREIIDVLDGNIYFASLVDYVMHDKGYIRPVFEQTTINITRGDYVQKNVYSSPFSEKFKNSLLYEHTKEDRLEVITEEKGLGPPPGIQVQVGGGLGLGLESNPGDEKEEEIIRSNLEEQKNYMFVNSGEIKGWTPVVEEEPIIPVVDIEPDIGPNPMFNLLDYDNSYRADFDEGEGDIEENYDFHPPESSGGGGE